MKNFMSLFVKNSMLLFVLLLLSMLFSSCSLIKGDIQGQLNVAQTEFREVVVPNPQAEEVLETAFSESDVPWEPGSPEKIERARLAIQATGEYLRSRLSLNSSLPYYSYRYSYEFIVNQYGIIALELDKRVNLGAIRKEAAIIYDYVKKDITLALEIQRQKIEATEKDAKATASSNSIAELKGIYNLIKPLVDVAL